MKLPDRLDRLPAHELSRRVYGEPYEATDGTTVIPVSRVGLASARPVGVFVLRNGETSWHPAVDHTRIALMGGTIGLAATVISTLAVLRRPPWPDLSIRVLKRPRS